MAVFPRFFEGFEENAFDEVQARGCARSFGAIFHPDADRLLLQAKVAAV
jgi:hypothetical protein